MRIFISTGEVSGDLQGAMLIEALLRQAELKEIQLEIVALGGDRMAKAGATIIANTITIGSVGILEALPFILPTLQIQLLARKFIAENPPDILILIDYVNPNLSLGNYVRKNHRRIPIVYYIAPQDWAVPQLGHTDGIIRVSDRLLAIFQAEARYFNDLGANVTWVGHPLVDRTQNAPTKDRARAALKISPEELIITLLPASRQQEIKYLLPVICQAAKVLQTKLPGVRFLIPISLGKYREEIVAAIENYELSAIVLENRLYEAIAAADLAITKSGTVNLEIALLDVPQIVIYQVAPVTAWIARKILKLSIPFMSPANLVVNKSIVPELLQEEVTSENLVKEALELLLNPEKREQVSQDYQEMRQCLGEVGACDRAAIEIVNLVTNINKQ